MTWNKKHILQQVIYARNQTSYKIIERRYIHASELRKMNNGLQAIMRHDYKLRGKRSRTVKMFSLKYGANHLK